jgi:hypothetical protein
MFKLTPLKQGFLGVLAALIVLAVAFAAGIVAAQDGYDPNKDLDADGQIDVVDIQEVSASWNTSGNPRGALMVFSSTATTSGKPTDRRAGMHAICNNEDPRAHFCTIQELEFAWTTTGVHFLDPLSAAWIDNGVFGTTDPSYDGNWSGASKWEGGVGGNTAYPLNCDAWDSNLSSDWGYALAADAIRIVASRCNTVRNVACCR